MIYAIAQTEHAISELQVTLKEAKNAKWYRRLKIIQLSMSGISVPQLSEHFDLCQKTVRNYTPLEKVEVPLYRIRSAMFRLWLVFSNPQFSYENSG